ncbi:MAG: DUF3987 domain-containing protein [Burkholderiales bacterium]|nr:DUF3987 domain-containing protein [Burkholderiales bacterium]
MRLGIGHKQDTHEGSERFKLDHCPFNPDHGFGEAALFRKPSGELGFKCQHASCAEYHWQDVRRLLDGTRETRTERGTANGKQEIHPDDKGNVTARDSASNVEEDRHTNQPQPHPTALYGLAGEVGRAAAATTEANEYAVAAGYLTFLSAMIGRGVYLPIGNTWHHARIFTLHVGRSGRGRKGDALSLVQRIRHAVGEHDPSGDLLGQTHIGGLSTREGLALLIHDGFMAGKEEVAPIHDKRLWCVESEFANVLHQSKRDGNTLSSALRDAWDGVSIRPAIKTSRVWASDPHIALSGAITPSELKNLIQSRELTNGFANRFMIFWSERTRLIEFPAATDQATVNTLAQRTAEVIRLAKGDYPNSKDARRMTLAPQAAELYGGLYRGELNRQGEGDLLAALLERRAPLLLRMAMLFALTDLTLTIERKHIEAACAWVRYWHDSVRFIFSEVGDTEGAGERAVVGEQIVTYLRGCTEADRSQLHKGCFDNHLSSSKMDGALDDLLRETPPRIEVVREARKDGQGRGRTIYRILQTDRCEISEIREVSSLSTTCENSLDGEISEISFSDNSDADLTSQTSQPISRKQVIDNTLNTLNSRTSQPATEITAATDEFDWQEF